MRTDSQSKLITAIKLRDPSMVDWAIKKGANINAVNDDGATPLLLSVMWNSGGEMAAYLISKGAAVNCALRGFTPLMIAAQEGYLDTVAVLITLGADLEAAEENGLTSLMAAARDGHIEIVRLLLEAGANWNTKTLAGSTALDVARHFGQAEIVELLEQRSGIRARRSFFTELSGRVGVSDCSNNEDSHPELREDKP